MKALSLFSGIGGIDLACEWAGIETVAFCEREPFCQKVLRKHWPDVPIYDDVCTLTKERLEADGIGAVDIIHGGYPCQPFSLAGDREGAADDRHLWPEVKRLLEEVRPRWFVGENVVGHVTLGLDEVLDDLGNIGYTAQPFVIPACSVGASHRRDRLFLIAHTGKQHVEGGIFQEISWEPPLQRELYPGSASEWSRRSALYQPKLSRTFNGIPQQVDRIKSLGNAVVPQQIYPILAAIKHIDEMLRAGV
jgi:DNA (cytosine-5)-methyltransferase 1